MGKRKEIKTSSVLEDATEESAQLSEEKSTDSSSIQPLSDNQIFERLSAIKSELFNAISLKIAINGPHYRWDKFPCCIFGGIGIGWAATSLGVIYLIESFEYADLNSLDVNPVHLLKSGAIFGTGFLTLISTGALMLSNKCRTYVMGKISRPTSIDCIIDLNELNQLFKNVGFDPVESKKISSTKDLKDLSNTIDEAISQTNMGQAFKRGEAVVSALRSVGFFSDLERHVLQYMTADEKIITQLAPVPASTLKR